MHQPLKFKAFDKIAKNIEHDIDRSIGQEGYYSVYQGMRASKIKYFRQFDKIKLVTSVENDIRQLRRLGIPRLILSLLSNSWEKNWYDSFRVVDKNPAKEAADSITLVLIMIIGLENLSLEEALSDSIKVNHQVYKHGKDKDAKDKNAVSPTPKESKDIGLATVIKSSDLRIDRFMEGGTLSTKQVLHILEECDYFLLSQLENVLLSISKVTSNLDSNFKVDHNSDDYILVIIGFKASNFDEQKRYDNKISIRSLIGSDKFSFDARSIKHLTKVSGLISAGFVLT